MDIKDAKVGMFVCGNSSAYAFTNRKMTIGLITMVDEYSIYVMIIRSTAHPYEIGNAYEVDPKCFDVIDIKTKRLSKDEKSILNILSKKCVDMVDGLGRIKYNEPILHVIKGNSLECALKYSAIMYDLKEPLFTY